LGKFYASGYWVEQERNKMTEQVENTELVGTMTAVHNDIMAHIGISDAVRKIDEAISGRSNSGSK
jgi:hypothetical protein